MASEITAHYDDYYSGASKWRELGAIDKAGNIRSLWQRTQESVNPQTLEIGCGEGAVLAALSGFGWPVRGVEISQSGVDASIERGLDVTKYGGDQLPFDDKSVDLCVLTHVVEHLENPRLQLYEAARVGRWVIVEVPLEFHWRTPRNYAWTDLGHINVYNMKLIRHLLQSSGLEVVAESVTNQGRSGFVFQAGQLKGSLKWFVRSAALRCAPWLATRAFTYHGVLLCRSDR